MANIWDNGWEDDFQIYNESQVEAVLDECGVEVTSETGTHFLCLCPFHNNTDSPAFAIDKEKGLFTCFNQSCGAKGRIEDLPRRILGYNIFQAKRLLLKHKSASNKTFAEKIEERKKKGELPNFSQEVIDRMHEDFWDSPAHAYMAGRGFDDDTLEFFKVGYSKKKNLVAVPMYATADKPVGVVGRTIEDKRFRNSDNLPKREIMWNIHNARQYGDTVIVCEASFDAMRIHQAGYLNVVALLGGHLSEWHKATLNKYFSKIIIMTDWDARRREPNCAKCRRAGLPTCLGHRAGRDLGRQIAESLPNKKIMWAAYNDTCVYPTWTIEGVRDKPAKDASDMTDEEIRQCLRNAISNFAYVKWAVEEQDLLATTN